MLNTMILTVVTARQPTIATRRLTTWRTKRTSSLEASSAPEKDLETRKEEINNVTSTVPSESWTHLRVVVVWGDEGEKVVDAAGLEREENMKNFKN